jgi:hydrogenase-4 component E
MNSAVDPLLVLLLLLNFFILGTSRLGAVIDGSALQGILLGVLVVVVHGGVGVQSGVVAIIAILVKATLIPGLLHRAMRDAEMRREIKPLVGHVASLLLGAVATGAAVLFGRVLPLAPVHVGSLLVPASLATVLTGFLILCTRRKAINQVVGYLVLENGIFIMGLCLLEAMPFLVEVGVLLDLLVAVFVIGIIINHINREFASLDTARLSTLKE